MQHVGGDPLFNILQRKCRQLELSEELAPRSDLAVRELLEDLDGGAGVLLDGGRACFADEVLQEHASNRPSSESLPSMVVP